MGSFAIPLAVLGVGLIGEWLLGPKGKSTTAAPDSMPMLNSALRGQVISVTFGANRVPAQVVWTKNFTAVRQKSSGKGGAKGGGSGGFGSAKGGGAAGVSYLYYWDMMFNFGIMDTPVLISKGWVGSDQLDAATINAITAGTSSPFVAPDATNKSAHLTFTEAFFAPGFTTDDDRLDSWTYFEDQMGFACAWPSTSYVGFNQLELGQSPSVPQLSLELVPINSSISKDSNVLAVEWPEGGGYEINHGYCRSADGTTWHISYHNIAGGIGNQVRVFSIDDATTFVLDDATLEADEIATFGVSTADFNDATGIVPVAGTPFFYFLYMNQHGSGPTAKTWLEAVLYKINDDGGGVTNVGGFEAEYNSGGFINYVMTSGAAVGRSNSSIGGAGFSDVAVAYSGISLNTNTYVALLPDPEYVNGSVVSKGSFFMEDVTFLQPFDVRFISGSSNGDRPMQVCIVPHGSNTRIFWYVSKDLIDNANAHPGTSPYIETLGETYPNGVMMRVDGLSGITDTGFNDFFTDSIGNSFFPAADQQVGFNGPTGDYNDDWTAPWGAPDGSIIMARTFTDEPKELHIVAFNSQGQFVTQITDTYTQTNPDNSGTNPNMLAFAWVSDTGQLYFKIDSEASTLPSPQHVLFGHYYSFSADVTPPYIIKRILTSDVFGFAASALFGFTITENSIDAESYNAAVQYCLDQGFVFSVTYSNQDNLLTILNELVQLYGGFLTERNGKIFFNTVTATDSPKRTIDNHHLVPAQKGQPPVKITKAALEDGYNKIQFNYLDRAIDYKQNQAEASDEVDIDINGPRVKTYQARYVMAGSVAQVIATRALWSNLYGRDQYEFTLGWKDADIRPGDLVTLQDSFDATLSTGVRARITQRQENKRGVFSMQATREFPYIIQTSAFFTSQASVDAGYSGLVEAAQAPLFQTAYELPREFQGSKALCYFGYNQAAKAMGAQLYLSVDSGASFVLTQDQQPVLVGGRLGAGLEMRPRGYVESNVDFWFLPTENFQVATPTFVENYAQDDITQAIRAAGGGVIIVGSEAISLQNLTLLGQNHYRAKYVYRGWGGSPISAHTSGSFFHNFGAGLFNHEIAQDDIGTTLLYKIAPYNFVGKTFDISSIPAQSYTIKGLYWLPREQPNIKIFVDSAVAWDANTPLNGPYVTVATGGSDIVLQWPAAANLDGYGAGGFGGSTYGHWEPDATGVVLPDYRVEVQSINGFTVRSTVVYSGYFRYDISTNSSDFGGAAGNLLFKVSPFNAKGNGPVSATASIGMFW